MNEFELVQVTWMDSNRYQDDYLYKDYEIQPFGLTRIATCGYLVDIDDVRVLIARDKYETPQGTHYRDPIAISRDAVECILSLRTKKQWKIEEL